MKQETSKTTGFKRIGSLLLAVVMLLSLMQGVPLSAFAEGGDGGSSTPIVFAMGMNGVNDYLENGDGTYDYVEYGGLKWRVLDTENDAGNGNTGVFLLSEKVLNYGQPWNGYRIYSDRGGTSTGDTRLGYSLSDVRAYLVGDASHTYTKFRSGTALHADEVGYNVVTYYYYRTEAAGIAQADTLYYTRDAEEDAGYVKYTDLTELEFSQGYFYTYDSTTEKYTHATSFTAGTDYYYDVSEYSLADDITPYQQLPADQKYYSFARASSAKAGSTDKAKALGTIYYIGYHTTGSTRPTGATVTRTIVSGMTGADVNFASDYGFTAAELAAVLSSEKTEPNSSNAYRAGSYTYYGGSLVGDSFFLLSAKEADNPEYGFTDNNSRIAKDMSGGSRYWWLRASGSYNCPGNVNTSGSFTYDTAATDYIGLRPAFNLNRESVIFASAAVGGKSNTAVGGVINRGEAAENFWENPAPAGTDDWKLTLSDSELSVSADKLTKNDDGSYTLEYSGASASGEGVYLSALLLEGADSVSYGYGRLVQIDGTDKQSGTVSFKLPAGKDLTNCNIKFFIEQCFDGSSACDYASVPVFAALVEDGAQTHTGVWKHDDTQHWHEDSTGTLVGSKTNHTFTDWTDNRADCDTAGTRSRHCTVCGYEETEPLPAGTHTWANRVEAVEPNCASNGNYAYYTCSVCGKYGRVDSVEGGVESITAHSELQDMIKAPLGHLYSSSTACTADYAEIVRDADGRYVSGNVELRNDASKHWLRYYCVRENCPSKASGTGLPAYTEQTHTTVSFMHKINCGTTNPCSHSETLERNGHSLTLTCGYTPTETWAHTPGGSIIRTEYPDGANPCTTPGTNIYLCIKCNQECEGDAAPARGHLWSGTMVLSYPTYDAGGNGYAYCGRCGTTEDRSLSQLTRGDARIDITGDTDIEWTGSAVSCGHNSTDDTFSFSHVLSSDGSATLLDADEEKLITTIEWYSGDTKLDGAPAALGSYTLKISVPLTDKYDTVTGAGIYGYNKAEGEKSFNIVKATQKEPGLTVTTAGPEAAENTAKITGSASASVSTTPYENAALTYSGNNDAVAAVNASTGAITLVGAGTVDITASYAETAHYNASSKTVTLTVLPKSSEADILTFSVAGVSGTVGTDTVEVTVPYTVQLGSVTPTITISDYAQGVVPASGAATAFTAGEMGSTAQPGTCTYTVTAEDGTEKTYTVTVNRTLECVTSVTEPSVQYIPNGTADPVGYLNTNYSGTSASLEGGGSVTLGVIWALENPEAAEYGDTQGAENTFRWTATPPTGYNAGTADYTGTLSITNQPVSEIPQGSINDPGTITLSSDTSANTVTLTVSLTAGSTGTVSYQWQQSVSGGWTDLGGQTANALTLSELDMTYNGASYRCVVTNSEGGDKADGVGHIAAAPLSVQKGSQSAPTTAAFSAETMQLTGVDTAMEYSLDGTGYTAVADTSVDLSAISQACTISVRYKETDYLNASPAQTIAVTKASAPAVGPVHPDTVGGNGSISGLDATMEVSADGSTWTAPASEYAPGSYLVRVKAAGTALCSDTTSVKILNRYAVTSSGDTEHYTVTDIPESALEESGFSFTVTPDTGYAVAVTVNDTAQSAASTYSVSGISGDVAISFAVSAKSYNVQFSTSGSACTAITVTYGQPYGTLPVTTRAAYRFEGWYLEESHTNLVTDASTVETADNHILYAKFVAKAVLSPSMDKVTAYYDGSGHGVTPKFVSSVGSTVVTDGFTVSYKVKDSEDSTYTETAPTDEGEYTVRFVRAEDNDYAAVSQALELLEIKPMQISTAALTVTAPAQGEAPEDAVSADTDPKYTIDKTSWDPSDAEYGYDTAYTVTVTLSANDHAVFKDGFAAKINGADMTEVLSADKKTATVTYTFPNTAKEQFTVTFMNGSTVVDTKVVENGDTLAASDFPTVPDKTGYTGAWDVTTDIENITEDKTVNAVYTANKYTLSFNSDGGSTVESKEVTYDAAVGTLDEPTRAGYTFNGWYSGETEYTKITVYQTADNTELKAKWTAIVYNITYTLDGGTYATGVTNPATYTADDNVVLNAPIKTGYTFAGWTGSNGTTAQTAVTIAVGSTGDKSYTANWTEATDTKYTVKHHKQELGKTTYTLADTDNKTGTTGAQTEAEAKSYDGFTAQSFSQETIAANGNTIVDIYYNRNKYAVTYSYTGTVPTGAPAVPDAADYEYGATVTTAAAPELKGYTFSGWSTTGSFTMGTSAVSITGSWTAKGDTAYKVEYYLEKLDGSGYDLDKTKDLTGATGSTATAPEESYEGFTVDKTVPGTVASGTIVATDVEAERLVLKLYYTRNSYNVIYEYTGTVPSDASALPTTESHKYGETVTKAADATAPGYTFNGWSTTGFTMPAGNVTVRGSFTANTDTKYKVEHWLEKLDGSYELKATDNKTGTTDTDTEAAAKTDYTGFTAGTVVQQKIKGDESTVVEIKYTRNSYTLTWDAGDGSFTGGKTFAENVKYGAAITAPTTEPTRSGYSLKEWVGLTATDTMPAEAKTYTASWTPNSYTVTYEFTGANVPSTATAPDAEEKATDSTVTLPAVADINEGGYTYSFNGWSSLDATIADGSFTMPAKAVTVSGTWKKTANTNTPYTVEHWLEKVEGGDYELDATDNKAGTTDTDTAAEAKTSYTGFTANTFEQENIEGDGSTVVKIYYDRKSYAVSYKYTGTVPDGAAAILPAGAGHKYGTTVTVAPAPELTGYTFSGWSKGVSFVMPAEAVEITGSWTANGDTAYTVEYYLEKLDSTDSAVAANYEKDDEATVNGKGQTAATATASIKDFDGFEYNASLSTVSGTIVPEGTLVLKVYYKRCSYKVTYSYTGTVPTGAPTLPNETSHKYGETVTIEDDAELTGYTFSGWTPKYTEDAKLQKNTFWQKLKNWITGTKTFTMPNSDVTVEGSFSPAEVTYKAEHYWQKTDDETDYELHATDNLKGLTGATTTAASKSYDGFTAQSFSQETIEADGTTVVRIYYNRNSYKVSYSYTGTVPAGVTAAPNAENHRYGTTVTVAEAPEFKGYTFSGWSKGVSFVMPYEDVSVTGSWTPITYTVSFENTDADGGTKPADMTATYNKPFVLPQCKLTRTAYDFDGWATVSGGAKVYADKATVKDNLAYVQDAVATLYPVWAPCALVLPDNTTWNIPLEGESAETHGPLTVNFKHKDGTLTAASNITWSIVDCPAGVEIDAATGKVTVQPAISETTIKIKAAHSNGKEATADVQLRCNYIILRADITGLTLDSSTMWVDGVPYSTKLKEGGTIAEAKVPVGEYSFITFYDYAGVKYDYCTHMYVWALEQTDNECVSQLTQTGKDEYVSELKQTGNDYVSERVEELDDIMVYNGVSIRVAGVKGMRIFTGIPKDAKAEMIKNGLGGYKLVQAGTVVVENSGENVVLSNPSARSGYAYNRGERDSVFDTANNQERYTNTLINFTYEQCKAPLSFRSYMIVENAEGEQLVLYGGVVTRSISYVAWQNKDAFNKGTPAYNYIWDLIKNTGAEETFGN